MIDDLRHFKAEDSFALIPPDTTKPATPLPWQSEENANGALQFGNPALPWIAEIWRRGYQAQERANAAYIVAACNGYPQLVADRERLLTFVRAAADYGEGADLQSMALELLRELEAKP